MFGHLNRARSLVVQLLDDFGIAGTRNLLCRDTPNSLRRAVERLTDVYRRFWKFRADDVGGFVDSIPNTMMGFVQQLVLPALQALVPTRAALVLGLSADQAGKPFVAPLDGRFHLPTADQHRFFTVCSGNQRVNAQIHANDGFRRPRFVGDLAHHSDLAVVQLHFNQPAGELHRFRDAHPQTSTLAVGQNEYLSVLDQLCRLISVDDVAVVEQLPRIIRPDMTVTTKLAGGVDRLQKFLDDLLDALRVQVGEAFFRPLFPTTFGWPLPVHPADAVMPLYHLIPQARRFLARQSISLPLGFAVWKPVELNRFVRHSRDYT